MEDKVKRAALSKLDRKPFVPKGFQVAKRVDGPQVKLLKLVLRQIQTHSHPSKKEDDNPKNNPALEKVQIYLQ